MNEELYKIAKRLLTPKKGILASDESEKSANNTLTKAGIDPSEENRRRYRELFINTPELGQYISGIILFEETLRQSVSSGKLFSDILHEKDVLVGIKCDQGTEKMTDDTEEVITRGLEGLEQRIDEYKHFGVSFTKWRAVIRIGQNIPTHECILQNSRILSEYAKVVISKNLVPIIEPEVLISGTHTIERCHEVLVSTLNTVFDVLREDKIDLAAVVLKTSMCLPGDKSSQKASPQRIAEMTVSALKQSVPSDIGGIVFLSGGQSPIEATENLNEIAKLEPLPWQIAYSYLRAIEGPALNIWKGKDENVAAARNEFLKRLKANLLADQGEYTGE